MTQRQYLIAATGMLLICTGGCGGQQPLPAPPSVEVVENPGSIPIPAGKPFKCELKLHVGEETVDVAVYFDSRYAVEFDPDSPSEPAVVYDLDAMSWYDFSLRQTVDLAQCEAWSRASADLTRASLAEDAEPELTKFVGLSLDPKLQFTQTGNTITLSNDLLTYRLSDPLPLDATQRKHFFAFDRLNAYRKAMSERKLGPFIQLAVDDALDAHDFAPGSLNLSIKSPRGDARLDLEARVSPMSAKDADRVSNAIAQSQEPTK